MKLNKKTIAVSTVSLAIVGGTAFAYLTTTGTGSGEGAVGSDSAGTIALNVDFGTPAPEVFGTVGGVGRITYLPLTATSTKGSDYFVKANTSTVPTVAVTNDGMDESTKAMCAGTLTPAEVVLNDSAALTATGATFSTDGATVQAGETTGVQVGWVKITYAEPATPTNTTPCLGSTVSLTNLASE